MSDKPDSWSAFFAALQVAEVPGDFLSSEKRGQGEHSRDPFDGDANPADIPL
ncbi:MAG: hypothetical protein ACRYGL_06125 [Janthinobacterium lividum]